MSLDCPYCGKTLDKRKELRSQSHEECLEHLVQTLLVLRAAGDEIKVLKTKLYDLTEKVESV